MKEIDNKIIDIMEKGAPLDGKRQELNRRLFIQLLAFGNCKNSEAIVRVVEKEAIEAVIYEDINDPFGIAILTMNERPEFFIEKLRPLFRKEEFSSLTFKPEFTMLGRTYALGHEKNLEDWLLYRPGRIAFNRETPWAVWYPVRRKGEFTRLSDEEKIKIMREHGMIGHAFTTAGLGYDIRLSSYGLDKNDNDFVIGLIGKELFPLSALVQKMRETIHTSTYIMHMGPFFIGKAIWEGV